MQNEFRMAFGDFLKDVIEPVERRGRRGFTLRQGK
jgi:hypothetical protein